MKIGDNPVLIVGVLLGGAALVKVVVDSRSRNALRGLGSQPVALPPASASYSDELAPTIARRGSVSGAWPSALLRR